MRDGMTPDFVAAIGAGIITTAILARFDFKSETIAVWTGVGQLKVLGTGDPLLDGLTFDPIQHGIVTDIGENSFSFNGSDELPITMNVPADPDVSMAAAEVYPDEYQTRPATLWRAMTIPNNDVTGPSAHLFRLIRTGRMDRLEISNDGNSHTFKLTLESHQALITDASNQTWLNQPVYDPADTSQAYAVSIANGQPAPSTGPVANYSNGIGGLGALGRSGRGITQLD